ncbi:BREX-1 system phosphatase PglZ type A [Anaerosolibacter sp.]|uniref:BREX-1 system phosphatase PglZ type A n=1 Tax=Anaerosolibacter sp. TaxID=1872527 RepID=UPI0039EDFFF1
MKKNETGDDMNLKQIADKLNEAFNAKGERKLVFWYDDKAEFVDEIGTLSLDNAKVFMLKKNNSFYTKHFLEKVDMTTNYLLYAPFVKPEDSENHLLDMMLYGKMFYADKISLIMLDLNIPEKYSVLIKEHGKFFSAKKYVVPFEELGIENYDQESIKVGMLSVLAGIKTPNFDEVLRAVLVKGDLKENKYIATFEKMGVLDYFWAFCNKYFGYIEEKPTLEKLVITLLVTYTDHTFNGGLPKTWQSFVSLKKNDVVVFVSNFMNNMLCKERYYEISKEIASIIKVKEYLATLEMDDYIYCDTFAACDELIVEQLLEKMTIENCKVLWPGRLPVDIIHDRLKLYFGNQYIHQYQCVQSAYYLLTNYDQDLQAIENDMVKTYTRASYLVDSFYREFYTHYDQLENKEPFLRLRQDIENVYTNGYLQAMAIKWADELEQKYPFKSQQYKKQKDFYKDFVKPIASKERVVVVISDAMRYEVGAELFDRFEQDAKYSPKLGYMFGNIPSYTKLGMGSLLPHSTVSINDNGECFIDGMPTASTEQRGVVLQNENKNSITVSYKEISNMGRTELRELFAGKEVVYVYHNQIDASGDHIPTENEVFGSCEEAMEEIMKLTKRLTDNVSATNYIITADHGFIYKRDKLVESDKVNLDKSGFDVVNKRYLISKKAKAIEGALTFSMDDLLGEDSERFVTVPRGVDIFKASGGGQNYVHGGASLQEIIIPVISLKTAKGKVDTNTVELVMTSLTRKITNLITYLDFMQKESVSDTVLPLTAKLYFIDELGEKISNENIILANKKEVKHENRMFKEKFTFKDRKYTSKEKYYLIIQDDKTGLEIGRHEFIIDIAFADNFGF